VQQIVERERERENMKTYQISDDRLVVVKKNLVVIKQKDSDKSQIYTRQVGVMHVCNKIL